MAKKPESVANVVSGCHFNVDNGVIKFKRKIKMYDWQLPETLQGDIVKQGMVLSVNCNDGISKIMVSKTFYKDPKSADFPVKTARKILENL